MKLSDLKLLVERIEADMLANPVGNPDPHIIIDTDMRGAEPMDISWSAPIAMYRITAPEYAPVPFLLGDYMLPLAAFKDR